MNKEEPGGIVLEMDTKSGDSVPTYTACQEENSTKTLSAYPEQNRSPSILLGDGLKQNYLKPNRDNLIKRTPVLVG